MTVGLLARVLVLGAIPVAALAQQPLPMTPARQAAVRDPALVHTLPGQFDWDFGGYSTSAAERAEFAAMKPHLVAIADILARIPALAHPVAADVAVNLRATVSPQRGVPHMVMGGAAAVVMPYSVYDSAIWQGVPNEFLGFSINEIPCDYLSTAPVVGPPQHGFPVYGGRVVITRRAAPLCVPATRGEYLTDALRRARDVAASSSPYTPVGPKYAAYLADSAERRKNEEDELALLAQSAPTRVNELRQQIRTRDSAVAAMLKTMAEKDGAIGDAAARGMRTEQANVDAIQAHLSSLSSSEREAQAWVATSKCRNVFDCLADPGVPHAFALVKANPNFFDPTRPTAIQIILVQVRTSGRATTIPQNGAFVDAFMLKAVNALDWDAVSALVQ